MQTFPISEVSRLRTPSCLCATKPPFLHDRAWQTVYFSPQIIIIIIIIIMVIIIILLLLLLLWRPTKHVGYFAHRGRLLLYKKKKQLDLFSERPTGFTLCFSHVNDIFQSFFQKFLTGLRLICLREKVRNLVFIICSLLVGIDCVTVNLKATFSWMKNTLFCPQIWSPERWKSHF